MSRVARKLKTKCEWCLLLLKWKSIRSTDPLSKETGKNSRNDVFASKQTTNKVLPNLFKDFEVRRKPVLTS